MAKCISLIFPDLPHAAKSGTLGARGQGAAMLKRSLIILFSTSVACLLVGMAINGSHNPLAVLPIFHIVIMAGMIMAVPAMIYGYLKGSILWDRGVREYRPYLDTALKAALANAGALIVLTGVPFMPGAPVVAIIFLSAFACGGVVASALTFLLMTYFEPSSKMPDAKQ